MYSFYLGEPRVFLFYEVDLNENWSSQENNNLLKE
jgi:hypothetical protein